MNFLLNNFNWGIKLLVGLIAYNSLTCFAKIIRGHRPLKKCLLTTCVLFFAILGLFPSYAIAKGKFPAPQGYVSDYAGVISPQAKSALNALFKELERKTQAEVAVLTIPSLEGEALETYAVDLFKQWGIGKKEADNGVLILLALKERKARIEVGYGLEGLIPDGLAGEIIRTQMAPSFKQGDFNKGFLQASSFIATTIAKDAGVSLEVRSPVPHVPISRTRKRGLGILNLLFLVVMLILFIKNPRLFLFFLLGNMMGGGRRGHWSSGGGGFGGGFGGFGGGMSGGGGASGGW